MSDTVTLEIPCSRCGGWLLRIVADMDAPLEGQRLRWIVPDFGVIVDQTPGAFYPATDGEWYRWRPGNHADLPEGEMRTLYVFRCPYGCLKPNEMVGEVKLDSAVETALEWMQANRVSELPIKLNTLLNWSA